MDNPVIDPVKQPMDLELRDALALKSPGFLEILRITRLVKGATDVLRFVGVSRSAPGSVRALEVMFVDGDAPAPGFDPVSGMLRLFYPAHERNEVERLLTSKRSRFCYFWRSRDGEQRHAWLLSSN